MLERNIETWADKVDEFKEEEARTMKDMNVKTYDDIMEMAIYFGYLVGRGVVRQPNRAGSIFEQFKTYVFDWAMEFEKIYKDANWVEREDYLMSLELFCEKKFRELGWW